MVFHRSPELNYKFYKALLYDFHRSPELNYNTVVLNLNLTHKMVSSKDNNTLEKNILCLYLSSQTSTFKLSAIAQFQNRPLP